MPTRFFAFIPAAGVGSRMESDIPKQYLSLNGKALFLYALAAFLKVEKIAHIFLILSPEDVYFQRFAHLPILKNTKIKVLHCGGKTRAESVLNALNITSDFLRPNDFALVHDAARALIRPNLIEHLIAELENDSVGGLLAIPVQDTLKKSKNACVLKTTPREEFWLAQTPQMFRYALLKKALSFNLNLKTTDESAAIEKLGFSPKLIKGEFANFKITTPEDLKLAENILKYRK